MWPHLEQKMRKLVPLWVLRDFMKLEKQKPSSSTLKNQSFLGIQGALMDYLPPRAKRTHLQTWQRLSQVYTTSFVYTPNGHS